MFDFLRGTVANLDAGGNLSLDVGGVGYRIRISGETRKRIALDGKTVTLHVRLLVKEDDLVLFGFADPAERAAFDLLTSVQQVGPAVAMAVLSAMGVGELRRILAAKDTGALRKVKGVGPKSAERIVLELADRVERIPAPLDDAGPAPARVAEEAVRALVVLGFGAREAADAVGKAHRPGISAEDLLRAALGLLR